MDWELLLNEFPLELIEHIFSFFSMKDDLQALINIASTQNREKDCKIRQVALNRLLKFVVLDPSCWVKEFSSEDYWYPTIKELKYLLVDIDVPITSNIQLCIHHNFEKNKTEIQELAQFLGSGNCFNIKCRLYMKDNFESICTCVAILKSYHVFHKVTHLELVSTTTDIAELTALGFHLEHPSTGNGLAISYLDPLNGNTTNLSAKDIFPLVDYK